MNNRTAGIKLIIPGSMTFEDVFRSHFKCLHSYACSIVKNEAAAEEIVQNVFFKLWEKKEQINISVSITAYLYRAVYNDSINFLKHSKVRADYQAHAVSSNKDHDRASDPAAIKELQQKIHTALNELPEQCRTIFQLSRYEDMTYRDIAARLGISIKTVENHMGKALRVLRSKLTEFLPILCILFINV